MLDYNTIFFAECQDGNEFLFHFINFAQTQVIFYSKLPSKNIPFFAFYVQLFSIEIIAEKAVLHLVTHHLHKRRSRIAALYTKSRRGHLHNGKSPRRYSLIGYAAV